MAARKRKGEPDAQQQQQDAPPPAQSREPSEPAESGGLSPEAIKKLKELGDLHEQNVLTDEEFEREKAKVLGT